MMARRFEWDDRKAKANLQKHDVSFEEAIEVFSDPLAIAEVDHERGEYRWMRIGLTRDWLLLAVVHVDRDDDYDQVVRLISARRATKTERRRYEHG